MDIIDILIAKSQSFSAETAKLTQQARKAMADANSVVNQLEAIENEATTASETATEAAAQATAAAEEFDEMKADIETAAENLVEEKIGDILSPIQSDVADLQENQIDVDVIDADTSAAKVKKTRVRKKNLEQAYDTMKNYTSTGTNEDGSMTQKAITNALLAQKTNLENQIKNITISGGGSGNISGNITPDDEGSMVSVDENGNIIPSSITETDVIRTQIISGTYRNDNILGLEIDYQNKSFTRLQGAEGKNAGADFNNFNMYGGRKRCIVDENGNISKFITSNTDRSELQGQRIMVYQPAFYYMRVPLSTSTTALGTKVNKEHIYVSDVKYAGFNLHPAFIDSNNKAVKYILLPAFESAALHVDDNTIITNDAQTVDLNNDKLISTIDIKPISGYSQDFNIIAARRMSRNNGTGWNITNIELESMNQMLMMIEYGTMNLQAALNIGITNITNTTTNNACITGSTFDLYNTSGRASSTINNYNGQDSVSTKDGNCAISYRGMENPYGGMWRFVDNLKIVDEYITYNEETTSYKAPTGNGWISSFGYMQNLDWLYFPIEIGGTANSSVPVGDFSYGSSNSYIIIGGSYAGNYNAGPFYYHYNSNTDETHFYNDSARVMFTPTAGSTTEIINYNAWLNS